MPSDDDWDSFEKDDEKTRTDLVPELPAEDLEAVSQEVGRDQATGRYGTLLGYEVARETVERIALARGRTTERAFLLAALRFFLVDPKGRKAHVDAADLFVDELHRWVQRPENQHLVEVALGWDKNPP